MVQLTRMVSLAIVLLAPAVMVRADDQVKVAVRADIDIIDAASVLAFSAKIGNVEIKARTGWAAMTVPQRQVFIEAHPSCPPTVVNKDWTVMTTVERAEILRCHPDTRVVLVDGWERTTDDDREVFFKKHPEARRRLEKVHGRGWHGGSHGRGNDGTRGSESVNDDHRGQGDEGKEKEGDRDEGKGKGHGRGKGHKGNSD